MLIKTVDTVITTNSAGQTVESLPVREVLDGETDIVGRPVTVIPVTEDANGVPVRFVTGKSVLNSAGQLVDTTPVKGARPAWAPPGSLFAGDLLGGRYWRTARPTCVRASDGYAQTAGGAWVKHGSNELRLTDKGLLVPEPSRTERIANNQMVGAVVGSPGTPPSGWMVSVSGATSPFWSVTGTGTWNGLPTVDVRYGCAPGSVSVAWWLIYQTYIDQPEAGMSLYASVHLAKVDQAIPLTGTTTSDLEISGGAVVTGSKQQAVALTSTLQKFTMTPVTITQKGTTIRYMLRIGFDPDNTIGRDFTIRAALPSLSYTPIDSPIATTGTAPVTRAADTISLSAPAGTYNLHLRMDDASETVLSGWTPSDPLPLNLPQGKYIVGYYGVAA